MVDSATGLVASPVDADKYYIVDLSSKSILSGPHNLAKDKPGLARLGALALTAAQTASSEKIFVVSRIGYEGLELLKNLGIRVAVFKGSLEDLIATGSDKLEKHVEPARDCPCCGIRRK